MHAILARLARLDKRTQIIATVAALLVFALVAGLLTRGRSPASLPPASLVNWRTNESEALSGGWKRRVPVLIDFTAEWCEPCLEMDSEIFQSPEVAARLRDWVTLRIDVTEDTPANKRTLRKYGVDTLPAITFLDREGRVVEPRVRSVIPVDRFLEILDQIERR